MWMVEGGSSGGSLKIFQQTEQPSEDGLWIKTDQIADVEFFPMDPGLCATSSNRIIGSITDIETVSTDTRTPAALYGPICEINNILYIQLMVYDSSYGTVLCGYDPYKQKFFYPSCFNIYYEIAGVSKDKYYMAMSAINNKLYLIKSGRAFRGSSLKILEYDPSTDTYVNNIPTGDTYNSGIGDNVACTINGKMYIFGGITYGLYGFGDNMYDIGIYDPSDNTMAIASAKMVYHAHEDARYVGCNVFAIGEKAYIIGNSDTPSNTMSTINDVYKDINIYDSATDTLVLSPVEACAGYGITAWVDDGKIYMCNGLYSNSYAYNRIDDCVIWIYDPETDTKSQYKSSYSYIHYKGSIAYKLHDQLLMFGKYVYISYTDLSGYKSGLGLSAPIEAVSYSYVDLPTLSEKYAIFYLGQPGGVSTKITDTSYLNISKIIKPNTTQETVESYSISNGTATRIC